MGEPVQPSGLPVRLRGALDAAELAVKTLGEALSLADALSHTRAALADVARILNPVDDAFDELLSPSIWLLRPLSLNLLPGR